MFICCAGDVKLIPRNEREILEQEPHLVEEMKKDLERARKGRDVAEVQWKKQQVHIKSLLVCGLDTQSDKARDEVRVLLIKKYKYEVEVGKYNEL